MSYKHIYIVIFHKVCKPIYTQMHTHVCISLYMHMRMYTHVCDSHFAYQWSGFYHWSHTSQKKKASIKIAYPFVLTSRYFVMPDSVFFFFLAYHLSAHFERPFSMLGHSKATLCNGGWLGQHCTSSSTQTDTQV